jgi:hypothetical protein
MPAQCWNVMAEKEEKEKKRKVLKLNQNSNFRNPSRLHLPRPPKVSILFELSFWGHNIQYNDTQHNATQHNYNTAIRLLAFSVIMLSVVMLSVTLYFCCYAECR